MLRLFQEPVSLPSAALLLYIWFQSVNERKSKCPKDHRQHIRPLRGLYSNCRPQTMCIQTCGSNQFSTHSPDSLRTKTLVEDPELPTSYGFSKWGHRATHARRYYHPWIILPGVQGQSETAFALLRGERKNI